MLNVAEDLTVTLGKQQTQLSPAEAFRTAERLIRGATRAIVQSEADRALVLDTVRKAEAVT
jgi:hypothetical protein